MNWLAHLYLSDPDPCSRIGNLLPDMLGAQELAAVPGAFQHGIAQHRLVDAFTDRHAVFRRSVQRVRGPLRRYGPVLVDVFYDHFLAKDWPRFSREPIESFVAGFYRSIDREGRLLPDKAFTRLRQIRDGGWLLSYADLDGVAKALRRTAMRLRKHAPLDEAVAILEADYSGFHHDFAEFFPELQAHVAGYDGPDS